LPSISFSSGLTTLDNYAFGDCSSLKTISLPTSLTTLGTYVFTNCSSLDSINLYSTGVTNIQSSTFSTCVMLRKVILPSGLTTLGSFAFSYCYSLHRVDIPSSVTSIGYSCFGNCYSLQLIKYTGTISTSAVGLSMLTFTEKMDTLNWSNYKCSSFGFYGGTGKTNALGANGNLANDSIPIRINWSGSSWASSTAPQLDLTYNSMTAAQMTAICRLLPTVGGAGSNAKTVNFTGNPGVATIDHTAATANGWLVTH
jgi:hypothetical protein